MSSRKPAGAPDLLAFLNRVPKRELQYRPRHFIAAHSEDGADEALDAEPGVLPGAVAHRWTGSVNVNVDPCPT